MSGKVNADDLASLMPQGGGGVGSDEASSLMSKLLEIQNRLSQLEGDANLLSCIDCLICLHYVLGCHVDNTLTGWWSFRYF